MRLVTPELLAEIERILTRGNTAEIKKLRHEVVVFECTTQKRKSAPAESRE